MVTAAVGLTLAMVAPAGSAPSPSAAAPSAPAAFPGARGFGAGAEGGRGGDVAIVTTLADSGPGSLREAIETASGPRTVVFEVAGVIDLDRPLRIEASRLTIAGQTSPGGITLRGYPTEVVRSDHVVLRYLRFRPGDVNAAPVPGRPGRGDADLVGDAADALSILDSEHVIVDHVSASWSMDETLSVTKSADVTVQHSIIAESLNDSFHPEGEHGYGSLVRGTGERGYTFWGNLWAHHQRRLPAIGGQQDPPPPGEPGRGLDVDIVNNVMYDWSLLATHTLADPYRLRVNLLGNAYLRGPSGGVTWALFNIEATADELLVHRDGNLFRAERHGPARPLTDAEVFGEITEVGEPFDFDRPAVPVRDAGDAFWRVLQGAGASRHRDAVDARVVAQVFFGVGSVVDSQDEVGGWPVPPPAEPAPPDRDRDGMADRWERRHGLDPDDPDDRNGHDLRPRWTNLEVYLDSLARPGGG